MKVFYFEAFRSINENMGEMKGAGVGDFCIFVAP